MGSCNFTPQVATAGAGVAGLLIAVLSLITVTLPDYFNVDNDAYLSSTTWDGARATLWELCETAPSYCSSGASSCERCRSISPGLFNAGAEHFGRTNTDAFPSMTYADAVVTRISLIAVVVLGALVAIFSFVAFVSSSSRRRKPLHVSASLSFVMMLPLLVAAFVAGLKYRLELFDFYDGAGGIVYDDTGPWVTTLNVMAFIFAIKSVLLCCAILHGEHGFWPSIKVKVFPSPAGAAAQQGDRQRQALLAAGAGAGAGAVAPPYAVEYAGAPVAGAISYSHPGQQHPAMVVPVSGAPVWGHPMQQPAGYYYVQAPVVTAAPAVTGFPVAAPAPDAAADKRDMTDM